MRKENYIKIILSSFAFSLLPRLAEAQGILQRLQDVGGGVYEDVNTSDPADTFYTAAGQIIQAFLSVLGLIFIILMLYGGYNYMIAAGQEAKVEKALDTIRRAIIGLIITAGSYAIWFFVASYVL